MKDLINTLFDAIEANAAAIALLQTGVGITLPTSEPAAIGSLWANSKIVTVSDGP